MAWRFEFKSSARKAFRRLNKPVQHLLTQALDGLTRELSVSGGPVLSDVLKLKGSEDLFRLRSGDWRVIFRYEHDRQITLMLDLGHRADIYRHRD